MNKVKITMISGNHRVFDMDESNFKQLVASVKNKVEVITISGNHGQSVLKTAHIEIMEPYA